MPNVIGERLEAAETRLARQPLQAEVKYRPAEPGEKLDFVVDQYPKEGTLSSYEIVRLIVAKAAEGEVPNVVVEVPNVVGMSRQAAEELLVERELQAVVTGEDKGEAGVIVAQSPGGQVAATPGMQIELTVGASQPRRRQVRALTGGARKVRAPGLAEAPRQLDRLADADSGPRGHHRPLVTLQQLERWNIEELAVVSPVDAKRLAKPPRARAEQPDVIDAAAGAHRVTAMRRLERTQENRGCAPTLADEVHAPVDSVGSVDVGVSRWAEHRRVSLGPAPVGVACRLSLVVGFHLDDAAADAGDEERAADQLWRKLERRPFEERCSKPSARPRAPGSSCRVGHSSPKRLG